MKKIAGQGLDSGATYYFASFTVCFESQENTVDNNERDLFPPLYVPLALLLSYIVYS